MTNIPTRQQAALDRRHSLDQQQKAFQGAHFGQRESAGRRRPPS